MRRLGLARFAVLVLVFWSGRSAAQEPGTEPPVEAPPPAPPGAAFPEPEPEPAPEPPPAPAPEPAPVEAPAPAPNVAPPTAPTSPPPADEPAWSQRPLTSSSSAGATAAETGAAPGPAPAARPWSGSGSLDTGPEPRAKDDAHGLLGPLRLGPVVGVGLPSLVSIGGTLKLTRYFGAGVNVGIIPEVRIAYYGEATISYQEYDVYGRIHPFGGGFFLGAGVGYARAEGALDRSFESAETGLPEDISLASRGSVRTLVLTPQLGYFHVFGSGFSVGVDFGAQLPIAPSDIEFETRVSDNVPNALVDTYVTPNDRRVRDTLETIGRTPLPTMNLRIGWLL